eukprot:scaffold223392_cov31-Tisochrysis_lutea.AAC.1
MPNGRESANECRFRFAAMRHPPPAESRMLASISRECCFVLRAGAAVMYVLRYDCSSKSNNNTDDNVCRMLTWYVRARGVRKPLCVCMLLYRPRVRPVVASELSVSLHTLSEDL